MKIRSIILVAVVAAFVPACSSGGKSTAAYCKVYDETHADATRFAAMGQGSPSFDELTAAVDGLKEVERKRADAAPASIKGAFETISSTLPVNPTLSQEKAYAEAKASINRFAEDECKLPGDV
jgi:hypothetical protein